MLEETTIPTPPGSGEVSVGAELGSYRLEKLLGKGAMGRVFRARHLKLGREVAIKVLNPEYAARPDVIRRFFREAQVVNQIGHEHIVDVTDLVEYSGGAFLVMELLDGQSLRQVMGRKRRRWPTLQVIVEVMAQVCDALEAAHQHGVVHRDLKPDNIFVVKRGGREYAKVLDFGVAKLKEPKAESTAHGLILGTPLYMSPEQASGKNVDRTADIWAAGVVLYQLLSGAPPFQGEGFIQLAAKLRDEPAPPLPEKTPRGEPIPPELAAVVMRCLEKRPADRFRSMGVLAQALRGSPEVPAPPPWKLRLRWLVPSLVGGGIVIAILYGLLHRSAPAGGRLPRAVEQPTHVAGVWTPNAAPPPASAPAPIPAEPSPTTSPVSGAESQGPSPTVPPAIAVPTTETSPSTPPKTSPAEQRRRPEKVEIELYSKPPGAKVVRLDTGEVLGKTPARVRVPRKSGEIAVRFTRDGYEPITASVDLATGGSATVAMRKVEKKSKPKKKSGKR